MTVPHLLLGPFSVLTMLGFDLWLSKMEAGFHRLVP